jgi:hypothetical protein
VYKKKLCQNCQTGAESFLLDPHSTECPYLRCYNVDGCSYYMPLVNVKGTNNSDKIDRIKRSKMKRIK